MAFCPCPASNLNFRVLSVVETFAIDNLRITVDKEGTNSYAKVSYPLRYGRFSEIVTPEHIFQFNLNGELKFIKGRGKRWPHPSEWLKKTIADDWVYYSTGGYAAGTYDCFGEYYVPCLSYPSNHFISWDPFEEDVVRSAIEAWGDLHGKLTGLHPGSISERGREFIALVILNSPAELRKRSETLHKIIGDGISVLPPDTRHVDYEVIPIIIADGCLYKCGFCRVKSHFNFGERSRDNIESQITGLKYFFKRDLCNYNSVFLGQHDALNASVDLIEFAAKYAFDAFDLGNSNLKCPRLFLFGSVGSLLKSDHDALKRMDRLPFKTYINIGIESADQETLDKLGKGVAEGAVQKAFAKIMDINRRYENVEITSNFVFGSDLPDGHIESFLRLMEKSFDHRLDKGSIYFSPLMNAKNSRWTKSIKRKFFDLKVKIPAPSFLYLIQRL